jgi:imidazoleglycerol-phosphate dehydratase
MAMRIIKESRKTKETDIKLTLNLDGNGESNLNANLPFLEHMLDQTTRYSSIDLDLNAKGDLQIDAHHTVEDIGITLGAAFDKALGDKKGIHRFGYAYIPLDEALSTSCNRFFRSTRPHLQCNLPKSKSW